MGVFQENVFFCAALNSGTYTGIVSEKRLKDATVRAILKRLED